MDKFARWSLSFSVIGLITNLFMISLSGVPISIPLGIFAIAFALISKNQNGKLEGKAKTGLILAIVALAFGLLIFYITIATTSAMADPETSKQIMKMVDSLKDQMPEEMQQMFEQAGF